MLPYCQQEDIRPLTYGALCRGLLSGRMSADHTVKEDDPRLTNPKFQAPRLDQYLEAVNRLDQLARDRYDRRIPTWPCAGFWTGARPGSARSPRHGERMVAHRR